METLTKKELVDAVAASLGVDREVVRPVVQCFLDQLIERLGEGRRVEFRDFGVFEVRLRAARKAHNPRTLERVVVPERRAVKFKPGRLMKARLAAPPTPGLTEPRPKASVNGQSTPDQRHPLA